MHQLGRLSCSFFDAECRACNRWVLLSIVLIAAIGLMAISALYLIAAMGGAESEAVRQSVVPSVLILLPSALAATWAIKQLSAASRESRGSRRT